MLSLTSPRSCHGLLGRSVEFSAPHMVPPNSASLFRGALGRGAVDQLRTHGGLEPDSSIGVDSFHVPKDLDT